MIELGNAAQTIGDLRGPGRFNLDLSLRRSWTIRERFRLEVDADANNLDNHAEYSGNYSGGLGGTNLANNPGSGLIPGIGSSSSFGTLGRGTFDPRQID